MDTSFPDQPDFNSQDMIQITGRKERLVNFNSILRTGAIPLNPTYANYHVDLNANDGFTRALRGIEKSCREQIEESSEMQALLRKDHWTRQDRVQWEHGLSNIVSRQVSATPGLGEFRNEEGGHGVRRDPSLNRLGEDIEHDSQKIEYDCEAMNIVRGLTVQKLENHFLPAAGDRHEYKSAQSYFYTGGGRAGAWDTSTEGHVWIVTPLANVIDGSLLHTRDAADYDACLESSGRASLKDVATGRTLVMGDGASYGSRLIADHEAARKRDRASQGFNGVSGGDRPQTKPPIPVSGQPSGGADTQRTGSPADNRLSLEYDPTLGDRVASINKTVPGLGK